jgi:hypothetical protein
VLEARELADLGARPERRARVDPARAPRPGDRLGPRRAGGELFELGFDPIAAGQQHVASVRVVGDRQP